MQFRVWRAIFLGIMSLVMSAGPCSAVDVTDGRIPLVTIRFNQDSIMYEQQLYEAVEKAVAAKAEVTFEIVTRAPGTGNVSMDKHWQRVAGKNTRRVIATLNEMGVPIERISVVGKVVPDLPNDEMLLFVM